MWWWRWHLFFFIFIYPVLVRSERICTSIDIRHFDDFRKLQSCTYVVGHVSIAFVELPANVTANELKSEVTEISDYLMVYRCHSLLTLESIFPQLRLIRGQNLAFDQYSLIVYENRNLRELGLVQLLRIQNGFIRIESNPMLCFVQTVDWMYLLGNGTQQHFSLKYNKSPGHCPVCDGLNDDFEFKSNSTLFCWNLHAIQIRPKPPRLANCGPECGLNGCDMAGNCCQRSCVTGCSAQNCTLCATFERSGTCVDRCLAKYELNKRQCISYRECRQLGLIPLTSGYRCVDKCPDNQIEVRDANGTIHCQLRCQGVFHVRTKKDLHLLEDCVNINGSLIIELVDIKEKIVNDLERALINVKEITGYLKVVHSPQLVSLTFLKNLDTICGNELIENKYALFVVDNHHLEHIWPTNRQVAILHGSMFFHLNPRLCTDKLFQIESSLKSVQKLSIADISPNSNGERAICGDAVHTLNATVEDVNATAACIAVNYMNWESMDILIGYSYYYMEAPERNITMYDGRHGCGHDDWLMDLSVGVNRRHVISNLKPYTQYAFFAKTLTRTDYHYQVDAYSKIQYFYTLPSKPSQVTRIYGTSEKSNQILIHWWPPRFPNGHISKYYVTYEPHNLTIAERGKNHPNYRPIDDSDFDCQCNVLIPYNSGPHPDDENYYNKDKIAYEDALPNLIYVSRKKNETKSEKPKIDVPKEKLQSPPKNQIPSKEQISGKVQTPPTVKTPQVVQHPPIVQTPAKGQTPSKVQTSSKKQTQKKEVTPQQKQSPPKAEIPPIMQMPPKEPPQSPKNISNPPLNPLERFELYRRQKDEMGRAIQDKNKEDFVLLKPLPLCKDPHASISHQLEEKCVIEEDVNGIVLSGTQHYYYLTQLKEEQYYRITIRACVDGVVNGCSKPAEALLKTTSMAVESWIRG
ncbi:LOW QUALITY PROTEIN: insulin-like growth factor 1 receptor [Drosophila tropicalis]|uniref:LOW QUALITY PROTEIN: insulin-like growth factor 1 receptor n=1 Tax=Drosophila tropicalis TaxID=46794 RepID=UPI0035ABE187